MTQRLRKIFITPFEKFLKVESLSGLLLFGATIISLLWANSTWGDTYKELWEIPLGFQFHNFELTKPLIHMDKRWTYGHLFLLNRSKS